MSETTSVSSTDDSASEVHGNTERIQGKETPTITSSIVKEALDKPIHTHVRWSGLAQTHPKVIAKDITALCHCHTINDITVMMYNLRSRWEGNGIFNKVEYTLEPTADGNAHDVCVHIHVEESKPSRSLGVFTTDTAIPEVQMELSRICGGRYSIRGNYIPPASRVHSAALTICSNVPAIGQQSEYAIERRTEAKHDHLASAEYISEVRASTTLQNTAQFTSQLSVGLQRRVFTECSDACAALPHTIISKMLQASDKGYVRHECNFAHTGYHAHPVLYNMYPLPITGWNLHLSNELATKWLGGEVNLLKTEVQGTRYWPLGPFCSLQWSLRLAGVCSYGRTNDKQSRGGRRSYSTQENTVPLNDRLFLSHCHVRGYKFIGPSTLDIMRWHENNEAMSVANDNSDNQADNFDRSKSCETKNNNFDSSKNSHNMMIRSSAHDVNVSECDGGNEANVEQQIVALGGNALWATSLSLNFPFLFFPHNGLAAMHFFANAGNLRYVDSFSALTDLYTWVRRCACSIGAGIVLTKIPLFGISPSGRFELNVSIPVGIDRSGSVTFRNGPACLFDRVRFGLVWSSAYSF